jgi:hypothetical protein
MRHLVSTLSDNEAARACGRRTDKHFDSVGAVQALGDEILLLFSATILMATCCLEISISKLNDRQLDRGCPLGQDAWDCLRAVSPDISSLTTKGLAPGRVKVAAWDKRTNLGAFPPGTEAPGCAMLADSYLGGAGAAWAMGERLMTLMVILLTAMSTGCFSSTLETASASSSGGKGPEGSRRREGEGRDIKRVILKIGESRLMFGPFGLLTTILVSHCCGTTFLEGEVDGA